MVSTGNQVCGYMLVAVLCGIQSVNAGGKARSSAGTKVYFGTDAKQGEFPFLVYTNASEFYHGCTGALIDRRWVLTAAHCLFFDTHVVLGDYRRPGDDGQEQVIAIENEIMHPEFSFITGSNDVGLIKLAKPANISADAVAKIQPLKSKAFMKKMMDNEKSCRALGWGLKDTAAGPEFASKLQKIRIRFVNETELVARGYYTGDTSFSFAGAEGAMAFEYEYTDRCETGGLCPGDSGGPVVCKQKGKWVATGINSFGDVRDGCMRGVKWAANVQLYYSWIKSIIDQ